MGNNKHHHHQHHHHQQEVRHAFQVITPQRTFKLCAPSEEEEIKWVAALRALINRERGLMSPVVGVGGNFSRVQQQQQQQVVATPSIQSGLHGQGQGQNEDINSYFPLGQPLPSSPQGQGQINTPLSPLHTSGLGLSGNTSTSTSTATASASASTMPRQPRASPSHLPPLITNPNPNPNQNQHPTAPTHNRTRSATQSAKAAVAEVVRRFNPEGGGGGGTTG